MKNITKKLFGNFFIGPEEVIPPAQIEARNETSNGRYAVKRTLRQWSTPQLLSAKCLLRYHKARGASFLEAYDDLNEKLPWVAEHYEQLHGTPLTREVVHHRFNTTKKKVRTWPRNNPYWPVARVLARLAGPISESRLLALVGQVARK